MFQPASLKGASPTPIDERIRIKLLPIYFIIIVLSFIPLVVFESIYLTVFWRKGFYWLFFLLIPFNIVISVYILELNAILLSSIIVRVVNLIHRPIEGVFSREINDKNYFYWNLRNAVKKWPLFLEASNPFPWLKSRFVLRFFGVRIGSNSICDNSWISSEFVEIGKNTIIGMGSTLLSFGIDCDEFILKKIVVEANSIIGAKCVLLPGTVMEQNVKLNAHSYTQYNQILEENKIYRGYPASLLRDYS